MAQPLFDPTIFSPEQAAKLVNIPGLSLGETNPAQQIAGAQAITPQSLARSQEFPLYSPTGTAPFDVKSLEVPKDDAFALTPQEQEVSKGTSKLQGLYNKLMGKSADQASAEKQFGVDEARKNISDLSAQLTALKNEAAAIPLQMEQKVSQDGTILTSAFNTQMNSRLRTNAIAALGVSSLLAASQGQLANAQALADRAVAQKYNPTLEEIEVLTRNLEIIRNDPTTTQQDRKRAQNQLNEQNKKKIDIERQVQNESEIWDIATKSAANSALFKPTPEYPNLASSLQKISQAKTKEEALNIAMQTGLAGGSGNTPSSILEYNLAISQGWKGTYQQWVDRSSQYKGTGGGGSGKTKAEIQADRDKEFEKFVKDIAAKVYAGDFSREAAKAQIRTLYPDYSENVIYDLVPDNIK